MSPLSKPASSPVEIRSEIGNLEGVILHTPGNEVENMTPESTQKALYSDILNLSVALKEYNQFKGFLSKVTKTYEVKELLTDVLSEENNRKALIDKIVKREKLPGGMREMLDSMKPERLAVALIEGVEMPKDNFTRFMSKERYILQPLHNFFFTRDASVALGNRVLISSMASQVRIRESLIMDSIFTNHAALSAKTIHPEDSQHFCAEFSFEGGDILVAREDILLIGTGPRTTSRGVDFILDYFRDRKKRQHIIVQELPHKPESFIHLDMAFTLLDRSQCMVYEPLILHPNRYLTIHIELDNGKVKSITQKPNIPSVLKELGMDLELLYCGGHRDKVTQEREQWHSGANFFAVGPGKIVGYGRNVHTVEELSKHGFSVIKANDIIHSRIDVSNYSKYVVTIDGSELSRGGGGCRCMTMPVRRKAVEW